MLSKYDLVFLPDLVGLRRDVLRDIALDYKVDADSSPVYLAQKIWQMMQESKAIRNQIIDRIDNLVFAGRTSITWYLFPHARDLVDVTPFCQEVRQPADEEVPTTPMLIGAAPLDGDHVLVRCIARTGLLPEVSGFAINQRPKTELVTVIVSLAHDYIEVRSDPRLARKVIESLRQSLLNNKEAVITRVEDYSNEQVEHWADALDGRLVETVTCPEALIANMDEDQVNAILGVLYAIDGYCSDRETGPLLQSIDTLHRAFGSLASTPFTALVLAGMSKIQLATADEDDLRNHALFNALKRHLKYLSGFIRFPVVQDGVVDEYTVRVGVTTKSVYFYSSATEEAIRKVRDVVLASMLASAKARL